MYTTNISGIILEGIAGTGKSTTLRKLLASEYWMNKPYLSSLVLSEHHTLRVLEERFLDESLSVANSLELLGNHLDYLEKVKYRLDRMMWLKRDRVAQKLPFIFERFHYTHAYHYEHVTWGDVKGIDERLADLRAQVFLLTIDEKDMKARIIDDYAKSGWQDYLDTLGHNEEEIIEYFVKKQDEILKLAKKSGLKVVEINSSNTSSDDIVAQIFHHWKLY